jgi:hypothetical protein
MNARKTGEEHKSQRTDLDEERRVREVQERIRRQIAERRGNHVPAEAPPVARDAEVPQPNPQTTQLPELFGGPLGRMLEELQKRSQPPPPAPPVIVAETRSNAELVRQQALADQLRALEDERVLVERRATSLAAQQEATAQAEPALRHAARGRLLGDLGDPQSLRRAFVLREVLGPPIGLR